jgi:predicted dehydrogenase
VKFDLARLNELEVHRGDNRGFQTVLVTDDEDPYGDTWWPPGHAIGWEHTFVHEQYEFLTTIADGGDHSPDFDDGRAVQRVMDAIQRSDDEGRRVELN